jgi:hypothetical protein
MCFYAKGTVRVLLLIPSFCHSEVLTGSLTVLPPRNFPHSMKTEAGLGFTIVLKSTMSIVTVVTWGEDPTHYRMAASKPTFYLSK